MSEKNIKRVVAIATAVGCLKRCQDSNNSEWAEKHANAILELMESAPSGSGIDAGTRLLAESTEEHLQFAVDYHHMDDGGCYDGWSEHVLHVTPSFVLGFNARFTGPDRNQIKEYLYDVYGAWLGEEIPQWTGYPAVEPQIASNEPAYVDPDGNPHYAAS